MSWRREHTRTNRFGTTFKVNGHNFKKGESKKRGGYRLTHHAGETYVNGSLTFNISCPGCGSSVFFYQNDHGSRIFFDKLGKPWPKHDCPNWEPRFETAPLSLRSWILESPLAPKDDTPVINVRELYRTRRLTKKQRAAKILADQRKAELELAKKKETDRLAKLAENKAAWEASGSPMPKQKRKMSRPAVEVKRKKNLKPEERAK